MLDLLLSLVSNLVRPVAVLLARGAVKLVKATSRAEDDELLKEFAKKVLADLEVQ